jgi:hypothetical protein
MEAFSTNNSFRLLCLTALCIPICDVCYIPVLYLLLFHNQGFITFHTCKVSTLLLGISVVVIVLVLSVATVLVGVIVMIVVGVGAVVVAIIVVLFC